MLDRINTHRGYLHSQSQDLHYALIKSSGTGSKRRHKACRDCCTFSYMVQQSMKGAIAFAIRRRGTLTSGRSLFPKIARFVLCYRHTVVVPFPMTYSRLLSASLRFTWYEHRPTNLSRSNQVFLANFPNPNCPSETVSNIVQVESPGSGCWSPMFTVTSNQCAMRRAGKTPFMRQHRGMI